MGAWEMPLDEDERKSLAYHLYRCVVESRDAGRAWMHHESFEQNVIDFQQDFFGLLVRVVEDIYNLEHATAKSISS